MARKILAGIVLALCVLTATVRAQGGPFGAQIENFWRLIAAGGRTFTSISVSGGTISGVTLTSANPTFTGQWTVNGSLCATGQVLQGGSPTTCTSSPKISAGVWGSTLTSGGLSITDGVSTKLLAPDGGAYVIETNGNLGINSANLLLQSSGVTKFSFRQVGATDGQVVITDSTALLGVGLDLTTDGTLKIRNRSFTAASGLLDVGSSITASQYATSGTGGSYYVLSRSGWLSTADKLFQVEDQAGATGTEINNGTPTLGTCTGGTMTSGSHNISGEVTGNTSGSCVINFGTPNFTNTPFCFANDETTLTAVRISARSNASITVTGAVSGDAFQFLCIGRIGT